MYICRDVFVYVSSFVYLFSFLLYLSLNGHFHRWIHLIDWIVWFANNIESTARRNNSTNNNKSAAILCHLRCCCMHVLTVFSQYAGCCFLINVFTLWLAVHWLSTVASIDFFHLILITTYAITNKVVCAKFRFL